MTDRASEDTLAELHSEVARVLIERIKDGTASAAELSVARGILKDNNITARSNEGSHMDSLREAVEKRRAGRAKLNLVAQNGTDG